MDVKVDKMICNLHYPNELDQLRYFKQFNVYENIVLNYKNITINKIDATIPKINIYTAKIIDTKRGTSLEGEYLSGKKLVITGNLNLNLVFSYCLSNSKKKNIKQTRVVESNMPFGTFIIIPDDTCDNKKINLRYLIEDITAIQLNNNKVFVSVTLLMQYLDQY